MSSDRLAAAPPLCLAVRLGHGLRRLRLGIDLFILGSLLTANAATAQGIAAEPGELSTWHDPKRYAWLLGLAIPTLPFLAWFVIPNFFRLAPWLWDNIKVLSYWWLGSVPVVALVLARLWERRTAAKLAAVALAVVLMASGALDIVRAAVGPSYQEFDPDGIAFKFPPGVARERTDYKTQTAELNRRAMSRIAAQARVG